MVDCSLLFPSNYEKFEWPPDPEETSGNLPLPAESVEEIILALLRMIEDPSVFVKSWAMVSLAIMGRQHEAIRKMIANQIRPLLDDRSVAIRSKAIKVIRILENDAEPIPAGWIKRTNEK